MKKSIVVACTTAAICLMWATAAYAKPDHANGPRHAGVKKHGLENALERGKKNDTARDAIRRALERKEGRGGEEARTDEWRVAKDKEKLGIDYAGTDTASSVTRPLGLPVSGVYGSEIEWTSSSPAVLSNDGLTVNRPAAGAGDAVVTLTATITYGDASATKSFKVIVKQWADEAGRVAADKAALAIGFSGSDNAQSVTGPLTLPKVGANGSAIAWVSSQPSVISNDGKTVNRPVSGAGDATVVLTATITYGGVTDYKTFTVTVKQGLSAAQRVAADKAELAVAFTGSDTAASVTRAVTLPAIGKNGSAITWVSSNPAVISSDGKTVNRPAIGAGDANVVMTAIVTYGGVSDVKTFTLTVKQMWTDPQRVAADRAVLAVKFGGTDTAESVTKPLELTATGEYGSSVVWYSSNPTVISNDGKTVNRPAPGAGDVSVVLTAIVSYNGYSESKTFTVLVKQQLSDAQKVAADKAALMPGFQGTDTLAGVTANLTLPATGANGSTSIWVSGNGAVLSNTGAVTRPAAGTGDATVTLTAVIISGGTADTKTFAVTVKQLP